MKTFLLADDLSNESLFGFRRSLALKQIGLRFCARVGAQLKVVHVDDPHQFQYQEPLYKKYLDHVRLNHKIRTELLPGGKNIRVEYQLEEGEPIATLTKIQAQSQDLVGVIAGTSNRFRLGRFRTGSRIKRLVQSSQVPVFVFGIRALKFYNPSAEKGFAVSVFLDSNGLSLHQVDSLKKLVSLFSARLKFVILENRPTWWRRLWRKTMALIGRKYKSMDPEQIRNQFKGCEVEVVLSGLSMRRSLLREIRFFPSEIIAVPDDFVISPFYIARKSAIPVVPLKDL